MSDNQQILELFKQSFSGYNVSTRRYTEDGDDDDIASFPTLDEATSYLRREYRSYTRAWITNKDYRFEYEYNMETGAIINTDNPKPCYGLSSMADVMNNVPLAAY